MLTNILACLTQLYIPSSFKKGDFHIVMYAFFWKKNSKLPNPEDIDRVICSEMLDKDLEPDLYQIVCDNMIHGPCGNDQPFMPCMKKGKCSKRFPKDFTDHTYIDEDGYPVYRRRDNGNNVIKSGVCLDNRYTKIIWNA